MADYTDSHTSKMTSKSIILCDVVFINMSAHYKIFPKVYTNGCSDGLYMYKNVEIWQQSKCSLFCIIYNPAVYVVSFVH